MKIPEVTKNSNSGLLRLVFCPQWIVRHYVIVVDKIQWMNLIVYRYASTIFVLTGGVSRFNLRDINRVDTFIHDSVYA